MTYKKLKEMGYNSEQWKNLTQEEANRIVANSEDNTNKINAKETNKPNLNNGITFINEPKINLPIQSGELHRTNNPELDKTYRKLVANNGEPIIIEGTNLGLGSGKVKVKLVHISPQEYINRCAKLKSYDPEDLEKLKENDGTDILALCKDIHNNGLTSPMYYTKHRDFQEGIHRAIALKKLGYNSIPIIEFTELGV